MKKTFSLAYGDRTIDIAVEEARVADVVVGRDYPAVPDVRAAVREALRHPIGSAPLQEILSAKDHVAVIASDITRQWVRADLYLPCLLDELNACGVADEQITLVVALGAHRKHTAADHLQTYGREVMERVTIVQSYAPEEENFVVLGQTANGVEVAINKHVVNADKVILTGGITYHSMAGFGGGRKGLIPGVSSYKSIQGNHQFCLDPQLGGGISSLCGCGNLEENPMHQDMLQIAAKVNPTFLLNAVITPEGEIARFVAGHWHEAWRDGCRTVAEIYGIPLERKADVAIVSAGGFPKDINFYQASKAIENAVMAVRDGGAVIALMECREVMDPPDFSQWFDYTSLYDREVALRRAFTVPGFVALKMGLIAAKMPIIIVSERGNQEFFLKAGMRVADTVEEALRQTDHLLGRTDYTLSIWPQGANTVPLID